MVRGREVQAAAAGSDRDDEHRRPARLLRCERSQQLVALARIQLAVEEADLAAGALLQVADETVEARVLREDQRLVLRRNIRKQLN